MAYLRESYFESLNLERTKFVKFIEQKIQIYIVKLIVHGTINTESYVSYILLSYWTFYFR